MSDETKDQKPLPDQPAPVVNPEDESVPQSNDGHGGNEGEQDDPPPTDPPPGNGDHPTKKPGDPAP